MEYLDTQMASLNQKYEEAKKVFESVRKEIEEEVKSLYPEYQYGRFGTMTVGSCYPFKKGERVMIYTTGVNFNGTYRGVHFYMKCLRLKKDGTPSQSTNPVKVMPDQIELEA